MHNKYYKFRKIKMVYILERREQLPGRRWRALGYAGAAGMAGRRGDPQAAAAMPCTVKCGPLQAMASRQGRPWTRTYRYRSILVPVSLFVMALHPACSHMIISSSLMMMETI